MKEVKKRLCDRRKNTGFYKNFFQPCFLSSSLIFIHAHNTLKHQTLFHQCPKRSKEQQPTQQPTAVKPSEWQLSASSNHLHLSSFTMAKILKIVVTPESSKRTDLISMQVLNGFYSMLGKLARNRSPCCLAHGYLVTRAKLQ